MVRAHRYEYSTGITASVRRIEQRDFLEVGGFLIDFGRTPLCRADITGYQL